MDPHQTRRLIENGRPKFGIFEDPVSEINWKDFRYMKPNGRPVGPLRSHFGCNAFQFMGAVSPDIIAGCAIVDLKVLNGAFGYIFFPGTGEFHRFSFRRPFGLGLQLDPFPEEGGASFGRGRIQMGCGNGIRSLDARLSSDTRIAMEFFENECRPMRISTRTGWGGWTFARKTAGVRVSGFAEVKGERFSLDQALGHSDWTMGFMRRETFWNWACFCGHLTNGRRLGMNISCGVNETSFSENCLWVNGKLHRVGLAAFQYDIDNLEKPWRITTDDGCVDLEFQAVGSHGEHTDALFVASHFHQMIGTFHGVVRAGREKIKVNGLYGFAEDHYAKW